jgi:transcriptional regulator with XRE-family HTH domain
LGVIGENIRRYRQVFGLSQKKLSELAGVSQPTLSYIERGHHEPDFSTVRKVSEAFGLPMSALVAEGPPEPPTPPKTPRTDEPGERFDQRFGRTGAAEAEELRKELDSEHAELEGYVKGLRAAGVGDEEFVLRRARTRLQLARERLFAVQLRQGDLDLVEGREAEPKPRVQDYIPTAADTAETLRMLLGDERQAKTS